MDKIADMGPKGGREKTKLGVAFGVFGVTLRAIFRPMHLLWRLVSDELRRRRYNVKVLPRSQIQSISPARAKAIILATALSLGQLVLLGLILTGQGTGYYGPAYAVKKLVQFRGIPDLADLVNVWFLASLGALALLGNALHLAVFHWPRGAYAQMMKALAHNHVEPPEGALPTWYYPGRMLFLDLVGRTGDELVKFDALWNESGFKPNPEPRRVGNTNEWVFSAAAAKKSTSTMIYDRYDEWTAIGNDQELQYKWFLGEMVNQNEILTKPCFDDFSLFFLGMSGSGKSEAAKMWLTDFLRRHPQTRVVIVDMKKTGDWDAFGPLTEPGKVIKTVEEALLAIAYFDDLLNHRQQYMEKKGYKNIKQWNEQEGTPENPIVVPPVLLFLDEYPNLNGFLKWEVYSRRDATPANVLFKLLTMGRSFGLWTVISSQFSTSDNVPSEINKNTKVHVVLRTGSEGESMQWINSPKAFFLGKTGKRRPDGEEDKEIGYAFVDNERDFVRYWYMDDWIIVHELLKYGVPTMEGKEHIQPREMGVPITIRDKLKALGGDKRKLNRWQRAELEAFEKALAYFRKSYEKLRAEPHRGLAQKKKPLAELWREGESPDDYFARCRAARGLPIQGQQPRPSGSSPQFGGGASPRPTPSPTPAPSTSGPGSGGGPSKPTSALPPARPKAASERDDEDEDEEDIDFLQMLDNRRKAREAAEKAGTNTPPRKGSATSSGKRGASKAGDAGDEASGSGASASGPKSRRPKPRQD